MLYPITYQAISTVFPYFLCWSLSLTLSLSYIYPLKVLYPFSPLPGLRCHRLVVLLRRFANRVSPLSPLFLSDQEQGSASSVRESRTF